MSAACPASAAGWQGQLTPPLPPWPSQTLLFRQGKAPGMAALRKSPITIKVKMTEQELPEDLTAAKLLNPQE